MRVWVIGHCRSGIHYAAHLFRSVGWDVGGEVVGIDGISAWKWAVPAAQTVVDGHISDPCAHRRRPPTVLHVIRKPVDCISAIASLGFVAITEGWRRHYVFIPEHPSPVIRAIWSYLNWNLLCRAQCTLTSKTENLEDAVSQITGEEVKPAPSAFNTCDHPWLTEEHILDHIGGDSMTLQAWERAKRLWEGTQECRAPIEWSP